MSSTRKYNKTPALAPFDKVTRDADLILHTSDGVDFHVCGAILRVGSIVFEDMFLVGGGYTPPVPTHSSDNPKSTISLVSVSEHSYILDIVLRIIYPIPTPKVQAVGVIVDVLHAASKYQLEAVVTQMSLELLSQVESRPMHIYSIGCHFSLEHVANAAANSARIIQLDIDKQLHLHSDSVKLMTAGQLYRLLWFLKKRKLPGGKVPSGITFIGRGSFLEIKPVSEVLAETLGMQPKLENSSESPLFLDPEFFCRVPPDITIRSSDQVDFPAHRFILTLESSVFANRLLESTSEGVLQVSEDSNVVSLILQLCYNNSVIRTPSYSDIDTFHKTSVALREYQMGRRLVDKVKHAFLDVEKVHPLDGYFIAIVCGWDEEANKMAKILVSNDSLPELYATQMEKCSARAYQRLLSYHSAYMKAVVKILPSGIQDNKDNCLFEVLSRYKIEIPGLTNGWGSPATYTLTSQQISCIQNDYIEIGQKLDLVKKELANIKLDDIIVS
ncbi:hypothetical protein C8Q75DRAFT_737231 [Abortiporus biennis]|nr:hypothetical protein C8Q75DRAFT_737231 [Abortiporus biennis]